MQAPMVTYELALKNRGTFTRGILLPGVFCAIVRVDTVCVDGFIATDDQYKVYRSPKTGGRYQQNDERDTFSADIIIVNLPKEHFPHPRRVTVTVTNFQAQPVVHPIIAEVVNIRNVLSACVDRVLWLETHQAALIATIGELRGEVFQLRSRIVKYEFEE